jgi:trafficking protein particle complex subunit 3
VRLIDEFLSKSNIAHCSNYRETADVIAKVAFKMFLGITCEVTNWNQESTVFSLLLPSADQNPLIEFVELPPQYADLCYCNIVCGVIKGALEMIQVCHFLYLPA